MNRVPRADHRSTLLAPPALLSVEVLTFGLLGEFGPEILLNRLGVVQVPLYGKWMEMDGNGVHLHLLLYLLAENLDVTETSENSVPAWLVEPQSWRIHRKTV